MEQSGRTVRLFLRNLVRWPTLSFTYRFIHHCLRLEWPNPLQNKEVLLSSSEVVAQSPFVCAAFPLTRVQHGVEPNSQTVHGGASAVYGRVWSRSLSVVTSLMLRPMMLHRRQPEGILRGFEMTLLNECPDLVQGIATRNKDATRGSWHRY